MDIRLAKISPEKAIEKFPMAWGLGDVLTTTPALEGVWLNVK